jgi:signal transduction histidine kinase
MMLPFRDVRGRLLLIVLGTLILALGGALVGFDALLTHTTSRNADALLRARAASDLALVRVVGTQVRPISPENVRFDGRLWIFERHRLVEGPAEPQLTLDAARSLAGSTDRFLDVPATDDRLYAIPIASAGTRAGTLVAAVSLAPYESTRRTATIASAVLIAATLVMVGIAVWFLLRVALRPVGLITAQAAAWSEHDLDRRFSLGEPRDEVTRLAATLDGLLDRIAASLRREQRLSAEISHELRTPLARLTAEAELSLRHERTAAEYRRSLELIARNAEQLRRIVDTLVVAARRAATLEGVADPVAVARAVAHNVGEHLGGPAITVRTRGSETGLRIGVDADVAERIVQPVVENAVNYARTAVAITVERNGSTILVHVEDDGPGVAPDEVDAIFEPGARGAAARNRPDGHGLGLALARRLARAASGDVAAIPQRGGHFVVRLPHG